MSEPTPLDVPIIVPLHLGLALPQLSCIVATTGLYTMTLMQMYLYFVNRHSRDSAFLKAFVLYLWGAGTAEVVLAGQGGWILIDQYWKDNTPILPEFIWARFVTILAIGPSQVYFAFEIRRTLKSKMARLLPVVFTATSLFQLASYIVILIYTLSELHTSRAEYVVTTLSTTSWAVNAAASLTIAALFLLSRVRPTFDEGFVSSDHIADRMVVWVLNSGLLTAAVSLLILISMHTASDLELFSGSTLVLAPLYCNMFLARLNSRTAETVAKPPVTVSTLAFVHPQLSNTAQTDTGLQHNDLSFKYAVARDSSQGMQGPKEI